MSAQSFTSYVVLLSMLLLSTLGSALHEVAGIHHNCGTCSAEQHSHAHSHGHSHANCGHRHLNGNSQENSEQPAHHCDDNCSLCILLAQSLEFSHTIDIEQCGEVTEAADIHYIGRVANTSCRLADPRGPPAV